MTVTPISDADDAEPRTLGGVAGSGALREDRGALPVGPAPTTPPVAGQETHTPLQLNHEQRVAAEYSGGHVLVLAGAGTGKTRTIIARASHLICSGVDPSRILVMTFTRKAARELTHRLETIVGSESAKVVTGTFHHFCLLTMRRMPRRFGIEAETVIDRDDQTQLMKLARGSFLVPKENFPKPAELVNSYSYARNTNCPARDYLQKHTDYDAATIEKMCQMFTSYEERKRKNSYLDYDDILFRFAHVLHESSDVHRQLSGLYDHILVDEMQDTNPLQWLILDGLRDPAKLFCVGDDAQSIYSFRGADFENVHSFTQRIPGSAVLKLQENYRSTQELLDVANWLLRQSPLKYDKDLRAHRGSGLMPRLVEFESDLNEASWIAKDVIRRHNEGTQWREQMILTRTARASRAVEAALIEHRIPYEFIGGMGLLQTAHVKDLLSLIRAAGSHRDELAWVRYLTLWPKIGDITARKLIDSISQFSEIDDALIQLRSKLARRPEIFHGPDIVREHFATPSAAISNAASFLEPLLEVEYRNDWIERRKDFDLLVRIAERHNSLFEFLETYTLDPISTTSAERLEVEDKVPLITVHSAKGTEAKVCYVIQAEPGQYPFFWNLGDRAAEEEDRRVLYVAMTRAKDELIITRTNSYRGSPVVWGGAAGVYSYGGTPYFLQELPANVVVRDAVDFTGITYSGSQVTVPTRRCPPRGDATCRCCHKRSYMRVLSGDIGLCDNCWPSDAQLSYAVSLGIDVPSDVSRNRLSDLISEYQESKGIWRESRLELSHGTQPIQVPDGSGSTEEQYDVFSERPARRAVDRMLSTDDPRERHKSKTLSEPQLNDLRETKREFEGLSEDALILLHGREQCWGLLLFFQVLNDEMARYERLRNATVFGAGYSRDKLLSPYYRPSWIKRIMDEMVRVVRAMAKLLESTKNYAGEPSSAVAIVRSAKKLGLLYEQLLELSFECATTCPDPRFDRAWHVLSDEIRAVASQLKAFGISSIAAIREIVAAPDTGVQKSLTLTFVPQFDVEGFDHEVTKAIEGMYP